MFTVSLFFLKEFNKFRQDVYDSESVLLDTIEYTFEVKHPYAFLMTFLREKIYGPNYANKCNTKQSKQSKQKTHLQKTTQSIHK